MKRDYTFELPNNWNKLAERDTGFYEAGKAAFESRIRYLLEALSCVDDRETFTKNQVINLLKEMLQ